MWSAQESQPNGRLKFPLIKSITIQALKALSYLHEEGIIHRDLKRENILLPSCEPTIKLTDIGVSLSAQRRTAGTLCGTLAFVAPEAYEARLFSGCYDSAVDIWALAMVMWLLNPSTWGGEVPEISDLESYPCYLDICLDFAEYIYRISFGTSQDSEV